jgi:hypothetical protein
MLYSFELRHKNMENHIHCMEETSGKYKGAGEIVIYQQDEITRPEVMLRDGPGAKACVGLMCRTGRKFWPDLESRVRFGAKMDTALPEKGLFRVKRGEPCPKTVKKGYGS